MKIVFFYSLILKNLIGLLLFAASDVQHDLVDPQIGHDRLRRAACLDRLQIPGLQPHQQRPSSSNPAPES